jgi:serine O-acetyltransferase
MLMDHETSEHSSVSATEPVWSREEPRRYWDPPRRLIKSVRDYERLLERRPIGWRLRSKLCVLRHRFWSVACSASLPLGTKVGGGLVLLHPEGVVIHPNTVLGPNCLILSGVTLGTGGPVPGVPTIGGHVDIGTGAKILGGVRIGDHAKIGANAVVIADVPAGATAVGVPARTILPARSRERDPA